MLSLAEYEAGVDHMCGFHRSQRDPSTNFFTFEVEHCPMCEAITRDERKRAARDEEVRKQAGDDAAKANLPSDGAKVYLRQVWPDETDRRLPDAGQPKAADDHGQQ